jgi:hypothetical protein
METTLPFLEQLVFRANALASEIDFVARNWRFQNLDFAGIQLECSWQSRYSQNDCAACALISLDPTIRVS